MVWIALFKYICSQCLFCWEREKERETHTRRKGEDDRLRASMLFVVDVVLVLVALEIT